MPMMGDCGLMVVRVTAKPDSRWDLRPNRSNAALLFPETSRKIIDAGLDTLKISFAGTDEDSHNATMKRLDVKKLQYDTYPVCRSCDWGRRC
jgi:hypothetical protein